MSYLPQCVVVVALGAAGKVGHQITKSKSSNPERLMPSELVGKQKDFLPVTFISFKSSFRYDFFFILIVSSWGLWIDEVSDKILMLVGSELLWSILIVASGSSAANKSRSFLQCKIQNVDDRIREIV